MKLNEKSYALMVVFLCLGAIACSLFLTSDAVAMGNSSPGRKMWDLALLWINFGILVIIFLKYGKRPLMDFLRGEQSKVEDHLNEINESFEAAKTGMDAQADNLENIEKRLEEVRESILEIGRREKEKLIEQGKITAEKMIKDAEDYANYQIAMAKRELSEEMVEIAVSMVEEKLIKGISEEDNEKLIGQFVIDLEAYKSKV